MTKRVSIKYMIPVSSVDSFMSTVSALAKRAERLGCPPVRVKRTGREEYRPFPTEETDRDGNREQGDEKQGFINEVRRYQAIEMEVTITPPRVAGSRLVARVDRDEQGNIVSDLEGLGLPAEYRSPSGICDHCQSSRRVRKIVYIIEKDGDYMQVGKSCIDDYAGIDTMEPLRVLSYFESLTKLHKRLIEMETPRYYETQFYTVRDIIAASVMIILRHGYVKVSAGNDMVPTRDIVQNFFHVGGNMERWKRLYEAYIPQRASYVTADRTLEFIERMKESDYTTSLREVVSQGYVETISAGILASAAWLYIRDNNVSIEAFDDYEGRKRNIISGGRSRSGDKNSSSEAASASDAGRDAGQDKNSPAVRENIFIGNIGDKVEVSVTLRKRRSLGVSEYGGEKKERFVYNFADENNNTLCWFTAIDLGIDGGDSIRLRGTVKKHSVYRDINQTILTRCRMAS